MPDLTSPTPLASALSSLSFLIGVGLIYVLITHARRKKKTSNESDLFEHIVSGLRRLDRTLVHLFSWFTGTRYRQRYIRLPVLIVYFLTLTSGSVFLLWPYSMCCIGLGIFSIFFVFRHWSRDEDEAVSGVSYERKDIKIDNTLGAEVLIAVGFLFVFAPIAFAQLQTQGIGFTLESHAGPFTFLIYTLIETVKAGSLVDYYDLYADRVGFDRIGVATDPSSWAKATIMAYRLSLNLLLLAAIKRLLDIAKRRADGADLRALAEALRQSDPDKQSQAIARLKDFALQGRGNARDMLESIAEPRQSAHLPIIPETRFAAADALLDYGTQRGGASALYAAADGYRALMRTGFNPETEPRKWRAAAHNLGNTLVQLGQQIGDPERLREATAIYENLISKSEAEASQAAHLNLRIVKANVMADLAMMTGDRADLERSVAHYKKALDNADPANHSEQIALLQTNLGASLVDLAEIDSDDSLINEAIAAYRAALSHLSADTDRETWSMAQNNLGNALADLGHWRRDATHLQESLKAHEQALSARQRADAPLLWAMSQINLANALTRLARLEEDPERLKSAIAHYQAAQSVYQREDFPRDWSWAEASLASAHIDYAHMTGDTEAFHKALIYCEGAIGGYASAQMPAREAWAHGLKGNAYIGLERYGEAADAFRAARNWQTSGDDWIMTTYNLAACLKIIGDTAAARALLLEATKSAPQDERLSTALAAIDTDTEPTQPTDEISGQAEPDGHGERKDTLRVRICDLQRHDWEEGRYIDSTTLDWTLEIEGRIYHYRVTREEYIEEDGQGKGSGYRILDLDDNNKILHHSLWGEWMGQDRGPEFSTPTDPDTWQIGDYDGLEVFWELGTVASDLWMINPWDAVESDERDRLLKPEGFEIEVQKRVPQTGPQPVMQEASQDAHTGPSKSASPRYYHVSIQRVCGEFVIGHVSGAFYAYWKDREDFENAVSQLGDADVFDPDSPSPYPDGTDCEGWYAIDDIAHINNALFDGNMIYVDEVTPQADSYTGYVPLPDGYSEQFSIDQAVPNMPQGWSEVTRQFCIDTDVETPENPVFVAKSIEKGAQTDVYITTQGAFDLAKLKFDIWDMDGDPVIAAIWYDGVDLEIFADSSTGKAFYAYMGALEPS